MKIALKFDQVNTYDYLASIGKIVPENEAEFFVVLRDDDKLEMDPETGLTLTRGKKTFVQIHRMSTFRGIAFVEWGPFSDHETVTAKLIPA
ncbi:MAG: hypothetical protein QM680_14580 [Luteolibacter sp.]